MRFPFSSLRLALLVAVLGAVTLAPASTATAQTPGPCPSFQVLHDDHIGRLSLPAGNYAVTPLDLSRLSCASASDLFRQFLEDFNGRLPSPWIVNPATATFARGSGSSVGFRVARLGAAGGGGGQHPATGTSCPAFFTVEHNDHVGQLRIPAGRYRLTLLAEGRLSCARASRLFASFLQDFDGRLPRPWVVDAETGTFSVGRNVGFRIKRADGTPPLPTPAGNHPGSGRLCTSTFRVLHRDRIGALRLPAGNYLITLSSGRGLTCARASRLFRSFLNDTDGRLASPWVLRAATGTFTRGRGSKTGFRVKPARSG